MKEQAGYRYNWQRGENETQTHIGREREFLIEIWSGQIIQSQVDVKLINMGTLLRYFWGR